LQFSTPQVIFLSMSDATIKELLGGDYNILELHFNGSQFVIKAENLEDGAVDIYRVGIERVGAAQSLDFGNLEVVE